MKTAPLIWLGLLLALSNLAQGGSVRDIRRAPSGTLWAAGDAGLLLASDDDGNTWTPHDVDPAANLQQLWIEEPRVWAFGGRAVCGYPGGTGRAVVLRSRDAGKSFSSLPTGPAGWAYGGAGNADSAAIGGQPTPEGPTGVFHTRSAGERWNAVPLTSSGYVRGSAFRDFRHGYFVGQDLRIISLRNLMEPEIRPADILGPMDLTAAAFMDTETCWAVGNKGVVLRSQPAGQRWTQVTLPFPAGTRDLAELETIDFNTTGQCVIGGGLLGVFFRSDDDARRFTALPAPGPGPIRCIRYLAGDELLAGGDGGRIWRSRDAGTTWQRLRGSDRVDILFIVAAGDISIYPAVVAHAQAGLDVAVLYVSAPTRRGLEATLGSADVPPGQQLRAAAALAGAGGAMVLEDVPSLLLDATASDRADATDILDRWSAALDAPAEPVILRRIAAAIRLYRPRVIATGPDGEGPVGIQAENRLVARLAARAFEQAADETAYRDLLGANLPPHQAERLFVGADGNAAWQRPWDAPAEPLRDVQLRIDATRWPAQADTTIELLAQQAIWTLGEAGLLDRPARFSGYHCKHLDDPVTLMTGGLVQAGLTRRTLDTTERLLSRASNFRLVEPQARTATLLPQIMEAFDDRIYPEGGPALLAADRLLLAWARLRAHGQLTQAEEARRLFIRHGKKHPLYEHFSVVMLAEWTSPDFTAQWARLRALPPMGPDGDGLTAEDLRSAASAFVVQSPWSDGPMGKMLSARALAATQQAGPAFARLEQLSQEPYPTAWRELALRELELWRDALPRNRGQRWLDATPAGPEGQIDGRLDEPAWQQATPHLLRTADGTGDQAMVKILRTPEDLVLGLQLRRPAGRRWSVDVAIDADRDTWTQLVLSFNEAGDLRQELHTRTAPPMTLPKLQRLASATPVQSWVIHQGKTPPKTVFDIQAPRESVDGWWNVEIGLPLSNLQDARVGAAWNVQVRATADDGTETTTFYLRPQSDRRLLPERYAVLLIPPRALPGKEPTPRDGPTGPPSTTP